MADISTYLRNIEEATLGEQVRGSIRDAISAINDAAEEGIEQAAARVGTPVPASTVAEMEDTTKIYLYTGEETGYEAGHWYYYDGSAWTDGGAYNSPEYDYDRLYNKPKIVEISSDEPEDSRTNVWFDPDGEEVEVPTMEEFTALSSNISGKVDKSGTGQVTEENTTFFEVSHYSRNLANVADITVEEAPLTFVAEDNHFVTTISEPLTARVMPLFHEMVLEPGTYTLTIFADDNYSPLGGGPYIGLYTGSNKNTLYQYVFCVRPTGGSKTFTVETETTVYFRFRTQNIDPSNANYSAFGHIGFRMMLSKTSHAIDWESPDPTWRFKYLMSSESDFANVAMFEKIGVIGDSYASGQIYLSGSPVNYYNLSWGQVLARRIGASCVNFSRGGLTTKTWLENEKGLPYLQTSDPQGLYIIALGINDYTEINAGRYSLGTESDFDLAYYETTPDTFFGNMCKIIGYIKAKSPDAKIILSTMALNDTALRQSINDAIERCAELSNVVSVKQYEDQYFASPYYLNGMISGHPTAPNYSGMATAMERLINKCMNDNYDYFSTYTWD